MADHFPAPSRKDLLDALHSHSTVTDVVALEDNWLRVTDSEKSLLICLNAENAVNENQLLQGVELLKGTDSGVVFVAVPALYALGISDPNRGTVEALTSLSVEENVEEITDLVGHLLIDGFTGYPKLNFNDLTQFFDSMLSTVEEEDDQRRQLQSNSHQGGFPATWPTEIEEEIVNLVIRWVLRENPRNVIDLCSDGWPLVPHLNEYCNTRDKDAELQIVNLPTRTARVGRLVTSYRYPRQYPEQISELNLDTVLSDLDEQTELEEFEEIETPERPNPPDVVTSGICSSNTPDIIPSLRERASKLGLGIPPRVSPSTYLAVEGMKSLADGGFGAFVLPFAQLSRSSFLQYAFDEGRIHAILMLENSENGVSVNHRPVLKPALVLFKKEDSDVNSNRVRLIKTKPTEFDHRIHRLVNAPDDQVSNTDTEEIEGVSLDLVSASDLLDLNPRLMFKEPQLGDFLRDEDTHQFGDVVDKVRRGVRTGANDFFYFSSDELPEVAIPDRFLTPALKRNPEFTGEESYTITAKQADYYVLDLREFLRDLDNPTEEEVLKELQEQGYTELVSYIQDHSELADHASFQHMDVWFCPFNQSENKPPDLVIGQFSDGKWYRYRAESMILDQSWYGVWCGDTDPNALQKLLNSEPYQQLLSYLGQTMSQVHSRYTVRDLEQLPINIGPLNDGLEDIVFPPDRRRDQRQLDRAVIDRCNNEAAREAFETLLEPDDHFAWAWFLSPDEYEQFQRQYQDSEGEAREFVTKRLNEEEIGEMLDDISRSPLHVERWETIEELADEYRDGRYRLFLYGATPQFEGFIMDWALKNGHEVTKRDGRPYVRISGQSEDEEDEFPKGLGKLIEKFIPRGFGDFLQDDITDLRNTITHGEIIEVTHERAAVCLLALHTLALQVSEGRLGVYDQERGN